MPMPLPSPYRHCTACGHQPLLEVGPRSWDCPVCGYRHYLTPIPAACAMLVDDAGRLLVIRRSKAPGEGQLGLPGGIAEPGESAEQACLRELSEEVGVELGLEALRYLGSWPNLYRYQGFDWPTMDVFFVARVRQMPATTADPGEVSGVLTLDLGQASSADFAFESNVRAVQALEEAWTAGRL